MPPRCRMPCTDCAVSSRNTPSVTPRQPSSNPRTAYRWTPIALRTTARIAALRPGQSPPPVRMPIRFTVLLVETGRLKGGPAKVE